MNKDGVTYILLLERCGIGFHVLFLAFDEDGVTSKGLRLDLYMRLRSIKRGGQEKAQINAVIPIPDHATTGMYNRLQLFFLTQWRCTGLKS